MTGNRQDLQVLREARKAANVRIRHVRQNIEARAPHIALQGVGAAASVAVVVAVGIAVEDTDVHQRADVVSAYSAKQNLKSQSS